ncbi:MAG: hypothetical protein R2911_00630 [Caldilineaceae bacterium]
MARWDDFVISMTNAESRYYVTDAPGWTGRRGVSTLGSDAVCRAGAPVTEVGCEEGFYSIECTLSLSKGTLD